MSVICSFCCFVFTVLTEMLFFFRLLPNVTCSYLQFFFCGMSLKPGLCPTLAVAYFLMQEALVMQDKYPTNARDAAGTTGKMQRPKWCLFCRCMLFVGWKLGFSLSRGFFLLLLTESFLVLSYNRDSCLKTCPNCLSLPCEVICYCCCLFAVTKLSLHLQSR